MQYADPLTSTIAHRTWSHSWVTQTVVSPLLAHAANLYLPKLSFKQWFLLIWFCFITHTLLDCLTIYGTGALWPLTSNTAMQGSIFIIDLAYTLLLLIGVVFAWRKRTSSTATNWIVMGLVCSTLYLAWGLYAQHRVNDRVRLELERQQIASDHFLLRPRPLILCYGAWWW